MSKTKEEAIALLEGIAQLLELKGANPFKIRAYVNAARALEVWPGNLEETALAEPSTKPAADGEDGSALKKIPGIGAAIAEKLAEFFRLGRLEYYEALRAEFPAGLFDLFGLSGVGAKKIRALYEELGVDSLAALEAACNDGRVAALKGFGAKSAANMLAAMAQRQSVAGLALLGDVAAAAEQLYADLRALPEVAQVSIAGSYRRKKEVVHDLDFVVAVAEANAPTTAHLPSPTAAADSSKTAAADPAKAAAVMAFFTAHPLVESVLMHGPTKSSVRLRGEAAAGLQADLRVVGNGQFPFALNYFTGSKEHNVAMRGRALQRGWTLNEYRLAPVENAKTPPPPVPEIHTESDLYRALELDYIEPELRENTGELAAAEAHALPELVRREHLRGTFHNHTTASDGHATLAEMAEAARELGLQYLGIADHSKSSFQAHGLDAERLLAQVEEIARLNAQFAAEARADGVEPARAFRLFAGTECDILKDGSLDFPDDVLARLDYVVASVHAVFNLPKDEMTARLIRAIRNPHVTMLGHLTGRLLLRRNPYELDIPAILDAAAETGTWVELNANPRRLDMDWRWWPLAKAKGVRCVINPDAHRANGLQHLAFGVAIARKGWLTRADVANTLPLGEIEPALAAKRAGAFGGK